MGKLVFIKSDTEILSVDSSDLSHIDYDSSGVVSLFFEMYQAGQLGTIEVKLAVTAGFEKEAVEDIGSIVRTSRAATFSNQTRKSTQLTTSGTRITIPTAQASRYVTSVLSIAYTEGGPGDIPSGGTDGQVLTKASDTDYDVTWEDVHTLLIDVRNTSGGTLAKGTPVHATGVTGATADVIAARADTPSAMPATYVLNEELADGATGNAIVVGEITGVDTSSFSPGDVIYVAAAGGFTNVKPTGTNLIQNLGVVTKSNVNTGSGVVLGAGRSNDLPNIPNGQAWIGNASGVPTATTLSTVATTGALSDLSGTSDDITEGTTNLFLTSAEETKLGFISVTQAVDLDTMESDIATNNAKVSNVTTDLTTTHAASTVTVNSSDGTDATVNGATTSLAGVMTGADKTKLDGIETGADVTDETNVTNALDGATLTDLGTPASGDLILLQDASDSNNLKVAQFSTFGGGGGGTITALNNQAADRLTTIGATTTELDGEANLTFDGTTLTVAGEMKAEQVYVNVRFTGTPSNGAFLDGARIGRGFFTTGSITAGSVYYLGASAWTLADADAASTGSGLLAVATDAGSAAEVLLEGAVKLNANTGYSGASKGDVLYLSLTAGEVTNDISSYTTGDIVRVLGYVLDASNGYIYFNPDNTWLEI